MKLIIDTENPIKIDIDTISADDKISLIELLDKYQRTLLFSTKKLIKSKDDLDGSEPEWMLDLINNIGKKVLYHNKKGVFIGVEETFEDYYYIIKIDDKIIYETCVSPIYFNEKVLNS